MDILYRPNKELAESLIRNMLEGLLIKHPLFTKNVFSPFMEEVKTVMKRVGKPNASLNCYPYY
jgi:hypothetical protein